MVWIKSIAGVAIAAVLACAAGTAGAAGFTDAELAARADDGYRSIESWSKKVYRKLASEDGGKSDVEALALERRSDNEILIIYAGTNPKDIKDVLADLGIGAKEGEYLLKRSIETIVRGLAAARIVKSDAVDKTIAAMEGKMGGLKVATAKATRKGSPEFSCPKGSFFDLRGGGECWSCRKGTHRTIFPVNKSKACERRLSTSYAKAKSHGKGSGILKTDCKKGRFYDIGKRKCYSCPSGYKRSVSSVTGSKACFRVNKPAWYAAKFVRKALCPRGTFFDLADKGSCWQCPRGYKRHITPVKSKNACISVAWKKQADGLVNLGFKVNATTEKQLTVARGFMKRVMAMKDGKGRALSKRRVTLVGHSLGGFIAQVLAAEQAVRAVTFNAPGAANYNSRLRSSSIRNVSRKSDVVGTLGKHIGKSVWVANLKFKPKKDIVNPAGYLVSNHNIGDLIKDLRRWKR
tara:strand:- start:4368 stop:5753 length:1386 start_codon:yes stop_codon:yes gene_type:complete